MQQRGIMNISYDKDADCLYIQFQQGKVHKTRKIDEGILVDIDDAGRIYGIEIVGVSERMPVASLGKINIDMPLAEVPNLLFISSLDAFAYGEHGFPPCSVTGES